ncbi:hypothetical protein Tco_0840228 [Tanacetum coccineum]|uniref:Late embryogenesis abundant protein n=1 Tax=Tanacetum coccineum TaxID=301880 RepID=A0ABQ5ASY1_9ASTR
MENYKNASQDIRDQLNAKAEAVQIILTGIDNDIYSTVDACPNACEINRGKAIVNSSAPIYDQEPATVTEDDEMTKEKEIDKLMALISLSVVNVVGAKGKFSWDSVECRTSRLEMNTDEESERSELGKHNILHGQIQEVTPDQVDNSGPIFDAGPLHKVQNNTDNYNVFAIENEHPEQPESVNDIYLEEQGDTNITIDSLESNVYEREQMARMIL